MTFEDAIDAVESALRGGLDPEAEVPRSIVPVGDDNQLLLMPSVSGRYAGVKVASVAPGNPARGLPRIQGVYVLMDALTMRVAAVLDAAELTALRTPAVSAVAVRHLASPEARRLVVFGTGPQAWGHVRAIATVRELTDVAVIGRDSGRVATFLGRCEEFGLRAEPGTPESVGEADIVVCATTARKPLFEGRLLPAHATVVAIGSHEPDAREVDDATVNGSTVIVESVRAALLEAGDIVMANGRIAGNVADLVNGRIGVDPLRPKLFKSVGMAWEDLVVASRSLQ